MNHLCMNCGSKAKADIIEPGKYMVKCSNVKCKKRLYVEVLKRGRGVLSNGHIVSCSSYAGTIGA
jgi:hypothetical protein